MRIEYCWYHHTDFEVDLPPQYKPKCYWIAGWDGTVGCPQCDAEAKRRYFLQATANAQIPRRFIGRDFDSFEVRKQGQKRALSVARDYVERFGEHFAVGRCLAFSGPPGVGKTLLASIILTNLIHSKRKVLYVTAVELIRMIRATWSNGGDESAVLSKFRMLDLLCIDEIGAQFGSDAEVQQLGEVLDLRYREPRPTLVVSNFSLGELAKYIGERAVDRLKDNGGQAVIFNWESHRGKNGN